MCEQDVMNHTCTYVVHILFAIFQRQRCNVDGERKCDESETQVCRASFVCHFITPLRLDGENKPVRWLFAGWIWSRRIECVGWNAYMGLRCMSD